MKIRIPQPTLYDALSKVQNIVPNKATEPILSNVLIYTSEDKIFFRTISQDMTMEYSCEAEILEQGEITLPVRKLTGIVHELSSGIVTLDTTEETASMTCGSYRSKILGIPANKFPAKQSLTDGTTYVLDQAKLLDMLKKTSYAASTDSTRAILNGVMMNFENGKLICVATDCRRLALYETEVEFPAENNRDVILPTKAVNELVRLLGNEGQINITVKENLATFTIGELTLSTKILSGAYPDFKRVVLTQCEQRIEINREELLSVLKRISVSTTPTTSSMRLCFADNLLSISVSSPDIGEAVDTIAIKYDGPEIVSIFNPEFMMDPLRYLTSDLIYIEINTTPSPTLIKSDIPFLYVIMPLRV
jgi:DNA polymerase-3 subunit beta